MASKLIPDRLDTLWRACSFLSDVVHLAAGERLQRALGSGTQCGENTERDNDGDRDNGIHLDESPLALRCGKSCEQLILDTEHLTMLVGLSVVESQ